MEQFITMLPEEMRVWVKKHKPETSMIAGKLAEDYHQARKTADDDQVRSKEKPPEEGRHCLVCHKTGQGVVNDFLVDDLLLDTGCFKTIAQRDLVGEEQ